MSDELADAVAELYQAPPEDFVSARAERVNALRDSGDKDGAKQVAALRKPTVGAWLVNLLVGDDPSLSDQVSALADQLRTAQEQLSGEDLRALGRQRQELVSGLVARARALAKDAGRSVTGSVLDTEVESSLRAALADPDIAREVLSGQLTHATEFTGFGAPVRGREGKATTKKKATGPTRAQGKPGGKAGAATETAADRKRAEKRARAQERLREAEEALDAAEDEHVLAEKDQAATAGALTAAQDRRDALRSQLDEAQAAQDEAAEKDEQARWRTRRAAAALKAAQAAVARAGEAVERAER